MTTHQPSVSAGASVLPPFSILLLLKDVCGFSLSVRQLTRASSTLHVSGCLGGTARFPTFPPVSVSFIPFNFLLRSSSTTSLRSLFSHSSSHQCINVQAQCSTFTLTLSHFVPHEQPWRIVWLSRWEHCCPSLSTWRYSLRLCTPLLTG